MSQWIPRATLISKRALNDPKSSTKRGCNNNKKSRIVVYKDWKGFQSNLPEKACWKYSNTEFWKIHKLQHKQCWTSLIHFIRGLCLRCFPFVSAPWKAHSKAAIDSDQQLNMQKILSFTGQYIFRFKHKEESFFWHT